MLHFVRILHAQLILNLDHLRHHTCAWRYGYSQHYCPEYFADPNHCEIQHLFQHTAQSLLYGDTLWCEWHWIYPIRSVDALVFYGKFFAHLRVTKLYIFKRQNVNSVWFPGLWPLYVYSYCFNYKAKRLALIPHILLGVVTYAECH